MENKIHSLSAVWKNVSPIMRPEHAKKMRERRKELGIRQHDAAIVLGIAQGTISKIEHNKLRYPGFSMSALCLLLKMSPSEFFE